MSDPPNKPTSGFTFGQPASSNAPAQTGTTSPFGFAQGQTSLFGGAQASGSFGTTGQGGSSNIFGNTNSTGGGFSFTNNQEGKKETASPFAAFGMPNKTTTPESNVKTSATSIFGNPSSSMTSAPAGSTTPATTKPALALFGSGSTTPAGPPPAAPTTSLFNLPPSQSSGSTNLFGGISGAKSSAPEQPTQAPTASTNIFGSITQNLSSSGPQTQPTPTSLFGSTNVSSGPSLFSNLGKTVESKTADVIKPPASTAATSNEPLKSGAQFPPSPSGFSQPASQSAGTSSNAPAFSFAPNSTASQPPSASGTIAPSTEAPKLNLFSKAQQAPSSASEVPSFGQKKDDNVTKTTSLPATAGSSIPVPGTSASTSSLFNLGGAGAAPSLQVVGDSSGNPPVSAPTNASTAAGLGSSISGPAPGAQSRLKNKSMDEIITRWASDLSKYQKDFQAQAEKVASWDRMLVDNSGKISKLYSKTFQAERDMAEVERQLTTVEGQQDELSMYLDRYEKEVDEMMARQVGQGESLQGPDQERERTYKTAEKVSERLNEMGKDLTNMIEEINAASTAISRSNKPNDPLSQIVRVLNNHLSQLQIIDQGTAELQAKAAAAQKESQKLGSMRAGGLGNDAADDFYRSYMSRR